MRQRVANSDICAVFPSAGRGSRLGLDCPKIFVTIDRTRSISIFDRLIQITKPLAEKKIVVLSQAGIDYVTALPSETKKSILDCVTIVPQRQASGTADAVFSAEHDWEGFRSILVIWGDQACVSERTLTSAVRQHQKLTEPGITFPTLEVPNAYIDYVFDAPHEKILDVRMQREGESVSPKSISDVGVFLLSTAGLSKAYRQFKKEKAAIGKMTQERNFPALIPFLSSRLGWKVQTIKASDPIECRGINSKEDLAFFNQWFESKKAV